MGNGKEWKDDWYIMQKRYQMTHPSLGATSILAKVNTFVTVFWDLVLTGSGRILFAVFGEHHGKHIYIVSTLLSILSTEPHEFIFPVEQEICDTQF